MNSSTTGFRGTRRPKRNSIAARLRAIAGLSIDKLPAFNTAFKHGCVKHFSAVLPLLHAVLMFGHARMVRDAFKRVE
ncbi:MAG: hypothetical protein ACLPIX_10050 [Rhodomicrobium sp.]